MRDRVSLGNYQKSAVSCSTFSLFHLNGTCPCNRGIRDGGVPITGIAVFRGYQATHAILNELVIRAMLAVKARIIAPVIPTYVLTHVKRELARPLV